MKLPHEKLGVSELSYNLAYSQGWRHACCPNAKNPYLSISPLRKIWAKGRRDAKRGY